MAGDQLEQWKLYLTDFIANFMHNNTVSWWNLLVKSCTHNDTHKYQLDWKE